MHVDAVRTAVHLRRAHFHDGRRGDRLRLHRGAGRDEEVHDALPPHRQADGRGDGESDPERAEGSPDQGGPAMDRAQREYVLRNGAFLDTLEPESFTPPLPLIDSLVSSLYIGD